jgi:AAA ATPase-like protein
VRQVLCPVLVGRDEETGHLQAALASAEAGHGGTVLLTGEAGIGKSRLVREIARAAGAHGFTVLTGRAVAGGVPTPFRPFAEALVSAGRAGRLPVSAELDPFRPALGRLVPEWRQPQAAAGDESLVYRRRPAAGHDPVLRRGAGRGHPVPGRGGPGGPDRGGGADRAGRQLARR